MTYCFKGYNMNNVMLRIKEEGGCELYNMYKTNGPKEEFVTMISGDEAIFIDFDNKQVLVNGVLIFGEQRK